MDESVSVVLAEGPSTAGFIEFGLDFVRGIPQEVPADVAEIILTVPGFELAAESGNVVNTESEGDTEQ